MKIWHWRVTKWHRAVCLLLVGVILGASPGAALGFSLTTVATANAEAVEAGFRLRGSNDYTISVVAYSEGTVDRGTVYLTASRKDESVSYKGRASLTANTLQADLGQIARVDVIRHPSGRTKSVHSKCLGATETYEPATYEGVVQFNGEEGFTRARATRVAQLPAWLVFTSSHFCGGSGYGEATGAGQPGARLRGLSGAHGRRLFFQVNKNGPRARPVFTASLRERHNGIRIDRSLAGAAPVSAFRFARDLRTATFSPPAPFSGSASLTRSRNSFWPLWSGDLTLAFPGHAVPIAGPDVQVSLVHARFTRSSGPHAEIGG